jgi:hypothetical protein
LISTGPYRQHSATTLGEEEPNNETVSFGEALSAGTRLTLFSDDKPDRFFTVIKFWMDETSGGAPFKERGNVRRSFAANGAEAHSTTPDFSRR